MPVALTSPAQQLKTQGLCYLLGKFLAIKTSLLHRGSL